MPADPQHKATSRASDAAPAGASGGRDAGASGRARNADGRHRAPNNWPLRRQTVALSAVLALAALIVPTAWATDLIGAGRSGAATRMQAEPPPRRAQPAADMLDEGASDNAPVPDRRTHRQPRLSRSGSTDRAAPTPAPPDWLAACDTDPAEIKAPNGRLAEENLCELPSGLQMRADAAQAWWRLSKKYRRRFGEPPCLTDGYRSLDAQRRLRAEKPGLAARPGTSNHGWGVAVDLCGGVESFNSAEYNWLNSKVNDSGWSNPRWAQQDGSKPEPWHWEYQP